MPEMIGRRSFIAGLVSAFAAPAIVRASSIMPVRRPPLLVPGFNLITVRGWDEYGEPIIETYRIPINYYFGIE
jgi:hypothetical protein